MKSKKNKTLISSIIVITIVTALVIMFTSDPGNSDTAKQVAAAGNKSSTAGAEKAKPRVTAKSKAEKSSSTQKIVKKTGDGTGNRIVRVSRPGQKFRMVRVDTTNIPPESELRKWSRSKWVTKVSSLQKTGQDSLAQEYITAYNTQFPTKDLNNYLK